MPRWKGARGEWLVAIQLALMVLLFFGPVTINGWPKRPFPFPTFAAYTGAALILTAGLVFVGAISALGRNVTPLPEPKPGATLVQTGPYRLVHHPMYCAGILLAFGWALLRQGWLTLAYAFVILAFLDVKARTEERWLLQRFPEYRDYQRRVRRLVPFVY